VLNPTEGFFARPNPASVLLAGPVAFRAGADGLAVARFGFADYDSGLVENARTSAKQVKGWVFPVVNGTSAIRVARGQRYVRPGVGVTLMQGGDYWARFIAGAQAGAVVYASTVDGHAISGESDDAEPTRWYVVTDVGPGGIAIISTTTRITS
jgi:hypothetical protein